MKTRAELFRKDIETLKHKLSLLDKARSAIIGNFDFDIEPNISLHSYYGNRLDEIEEMLKQDVYERMMNKLYKLDYDLIDNDEKDSDEIDREIDQMFADAGIEYR